MLTKRLGLRAVRFKYRKYLSGAIACIMAYVVVLQVTLALIQSAWLVPTPGLGFGEICLASATADFASDHESGFAGFPVKKAVHCPLCLAPSFALLAPPESPAVALRFAIGIVIEAAEPARIQFAEITSAHRARAPPVRS